MPQQKQSRPVHKVIPSQQTFHAYLINADAARDMSRNKYTVTENIRPQIHQPKINTTFRPKFG